MTSTTELQLQREELRNSRIVEFPTPSLESGEVLVQVEKFALTANNVSYAVAGDQIGYWQFFPPHLGAEEASDSQTWGIVPVWGIGEVIVSRCEDLLVGERLYGYFPTASQVVLRPEQVRSRSLIDAASHRSKLPQVYNRYSRMSADPEALQALENERCLYFPLFITSYFLYDFLIDNDYFGAQQVILGSASSKTAFGLAHLLHHDPDGEGASSRRRVVGLTSPNNTDFVDQLGTYDQVTTYDAIADLDGTIASVFVDMAGSTAVTQGIHELFGDHLKQSTRGGATHWEAARRPVELPGPQPQFFFAPAQIQKREQDWGAGVAMQKANEASVGIAQSIAERLTISHQKGPKEVQGALLALLDNDVPPSCALMLSM